MKEIFLTSPSCPWPLKRSDEVTAASVLVSHVWYIWDLKSYGNDVQSNSRCLLGFHWKPGRYNFPVCVPVGSRTIPLSLCSPLANHCYCFGDSHIQDSDICFRLYDNTAWISHIKTCLPTLILNCFVCYRNANVFCQWLHSHKEVSTQEPFLWKDLWLWQFSLQWTMSTG